MATMPQSGFRPAPIIVVAFNSAAGARGDDNSPRPSAFPAAFSGDRRRCDADLRARAGIRRDHDQAAAAGRSRRAAAHHCLPQKGEMILQRTRPPLLETPLEVFDRSLFTPNDRFFVRWHWALIPTAVDVGSFRLAVRGHVNRETRLSLDDILALPRVELAAVNQCSGNSRGYFEPRVPGGQWAH